MLIRTLFFLFACLPALSQAADPAYFSVRADFRKCMSPICGGVFVNEVNKAFTRCADKHRDKACYAAEIDWSALNLTAEQAAAAQSLAGNGQLLLRGQLQTKQFGDIAKLGVFVVSEAWEAATNKPTNGPYFRIHLNGIRCIAAPCNSVDEEKLNTNITRGIDGINLDKVGANETKLTAASERLSTTEGILVTGRHKPVTGPGGKSVSLTASQFYLPFTASSVVKQCHVGGCSSEVCSDKPGAISACIYKPEYGCYGTASCQVQADGNCGWTPTKELTSCLDNAKQLPGGLSIK